MSEARLREALLHGASHQLLPVSRRRGRLAPRTQPTQEPRLPPARRSPPQPRQSLALQGRHALLRALLNRADAPEQGAGEAAAPQRAQRGGEAAAAPLQPCGKACGACHACDGRGHAKPSSKLRRLCCCGGDELARGRVPAAQRGKAVMARCGA